MKIEIDVSDDVADRIRDRYGSDADLGLAVMMIVEEGLTTRLMISATEAGEILSVSPARIRLLCAEGRFEGADKSSSGWMIPLGSVRAFKRKK